MTWIYRKFYKFPEKSIKIKSGNIAKDQLIKWLRAISKEIRDEDKGIDGVIFYYSGHGFRFNDKSLCIITGDNEEIRSDELKQIFASIDLPKIMRFDCCQESLVTTSKPTRRSKRGRNQCQDKNVFMHFACLPGEIAFNPLV